MRHVLEEEPFMVYPTSQVNVKVVPNVKFVF